jgi:DNA-binding CsgD family transcriptional regulator
MGVRNGQLVGREPELERMARLAAGLDLGRGAVLEIVGEPGIGKTSLMSALCALADERRHLVLEGRASEFEREVPFAPFLDALDDYLRSVDPRRLERLAGDRPAELAAVFPSLSAFGGKAPVALQDERFRSHRAVRLLLERLADRRPLVLALDDLHWADAASVELIAHLLRRPPKGGVLLAIALRSQASPGRLVSTLDTAEREGALERVHVGPLTRGQAEELLGDRTPPELCARLYRDSGGNPFYLKQLARAVTAGGGATAPALAADDLQVPAAVTAALRDELARLPEPARVLLQGAAVAGEPFDPDLAARAAGAKTADALELLDELVAADLVRPTEVPRRFRFRHPIVRHAVYESAGEGWRLAAHARAAGELEERGAAAAVCAHHVERSALAGDERAIALLAEAGHDTAQRAPEVAAHWFGAALRLLDDSADADARRLELLVPMATALGAAGRLRESRDALREVLRVLPPDLAPVRVQVIPFIAMIEHLLGDHEAAHTLLLGALHEQTDPTSKEAAVLQFELAADCFYGNDYDGMLRWSRECHAAARRLGDRPLSAATGGQLALACYSVGQLDDAHTHFSAASALADELTDADFAEHLMGLVWLGWYGMSMERYEDGVRYMERGLAVSRATGQGYLLVPMKIGIAICRVWQGRLDEATELAEDTIEMARVSQNPQSLAWSLTLRCWIATLAGDLAAAGSAGEEAVAAAKSMSDSYFAALAICYLAETWLEAGEHRRCRDDILRAAGGDRLAAVERAFRPHFYEMLTRAELGLGLVDEADRWAGRAEAALEGGTLAGRATEALRARAAVLLARGEAVAAAETALRAASEAERPGNRIDAARSRTLAGRALAAAGEREHAIGELQRASEELEACGAQRFRDEAARELRRLGRRVPRRGRPGREDSGVASLSGRELEVARLVATGKTNREIAAGLYVSERTVESHLSRVFAKLGVSKRAAVAGLVQRERATIGAERQGS